MTLDARYIIASDLQGLFRDKTTGLPLRAGTVEFFEDESRTTPKDVFTLTGSPPDYTYTNIGSTIELTGIGTYSDNEGNDIVPYYFPYVSDTDNTVQLYYVVVKDFAGEVQFTRQAWPNFTKSDENSNDLFNYIPNGQFVTHTNIPASTSPVRVAGQISEPITDVAQGGWTFERPNASTATDIVTFPILGIVSNPDATPRFACRINNQVPSPGDSYKDLRIKFLDVNKFSSDTQRYTFAINGTTNTGGTLAVQVILIKNFGTGGSSTVEIPLTVFTIQPTFTINQIAFEFGSNVGYTLGAQNDDFLQIALRFPTTFVFDAEFTDAILTPGTVSITGYPQQTDADTLARSVAGWMPIPNPDGSDLYLDLRLTRKGLEYDHSEIGNIISDACATKTSSIGLLPCDGTKYEVSGYSSDGIPYRRLFNNLYVTSALAPLYSTGSDFALACLGSGVNSSIRLHNNTAGAVTATADGTPATGFTFSRVGPTGPGTPPVTSYTYTTNMFIVENNFDGAVASPSVGTSGFALNAFLKLGSTLVNEVFVMQAVAATGLEGKYWEFTAAVGGPYYVWYQVNGVGGDPAPGGTGLLVKLLSTDNVSDVAYKTSNVLNQWETTNIVCTSGATIPAGSYFKFHTTNGTTPTNYYVWYTVNGVGIDPAPGGTGIQVNILSANTAAQVATATVTAINIKYFAVPDYRGYFLRGNRGATSISIDSDVRFSLVDGLTATNQLGTYEYDSNQQHLHLASTSVSSNLTNNTVVFRNLAGVGVLALGADTDFSFHTLTPSATAETEISLEGRFQSQPLNAGVNFYIKY